MRTMLTAILFLFLTSCSQEPEAINFGVDNCSFCKMTIMDQKFATQCISKKGKTFKFDDLHCMIHFMKNGGVWSNEVGKVYIADYAEQGKWIEADKAFILHSESLKSPMGGNYAAFGDYTKLENAMKQFNGEKTEWKKLTSEK